MENFTCSFCNTVFELTRKGKLTEHCECKTFRLVRLSRHIEISATDSDIDLTALTLNYNGES